MLLTIIVLLSTLTTISTSTSTTIYDTVLGPAEILGGPASANFDSPFHAFTVYRPDNTSRLVGYNANGDSYRIVDGNTLTDLVSGPSVLGGIGTSVGLNRSVSVAALDHCGCWLQGVASLPSTDKPGLVRGFYHEEWKCNYTNNGFTNKSIAYAESHDGGLTFVKKGWPDNQIILPSLGNTTQRGSRGQQIGEGDHSVVTVGKWIWLFFTEWDVPEGKPRSVGVARSAVKDGGVPGTWHKYFCGVVEEKLKSSSVSPSASSCGFTSNGLGGNSSALAGMPGSVVTWRPSSSNKAGEFIAIGTRLKFPDENPTLVGHGARLAFSQPANVGEPPLLWEAASEPLLFVDEESWSRTNQSRELYAYDSVVVDPVNSNVLWFYYTYLVPGGTFHSRYFIRRRIDFVDADHSSSSTAVGCGRSSRAVITALQGELRKGGERKREGDWWFSTAAVHDNYTSLGSAGWTVLATGGKGRTKLVDCYINQWDDHFVAREFECSGGGGGGGGSTLLHAVNATGTLNLRTLGFVFDESCSDGVVVPLYRCFNNVTKNHAVSMNASCYGYGKTEFLLGYTYVSPS